MSNLKPGQKVGRYTIIREIGSGGFGVTYLANSEDLDIKVAVKEYFPEEFAVRRGATVNARAKEQKNFEWGKKRFLQEARTLAKFRNPNIVGVRQIFEENNTAYMVLDYESGRNLKAWRKEINDQPTEQELIEITRPILSALEVIHSNDLLHRDISPDNIIVRNDGTPVLIDFGSSRSMVQKTRTVSAMVKSGYSPPELYSSLTDSQGPWSDIYSYAATIYFLITGKAPDEATNRLMRDEIEQLADTRADKYSSEFLQAVDAALSLKPENRPQSVSEWEAMLGLSGAPVPRRPAAEFTGDAGASARPSSSSKGNLPAILAAAFIGVLVVGAVVAAKYSPELQQSGQPSSSSTTKEEAAEEEPQQQNWSVADLPSTAICGTALDVSRTRWDDSDNFTDKVAEARRRGLSVEDCREILGLGPLPAPNPQPVASGQYGAIAYSNSKNNFAASWSAYTAEEAQRAALETCNNGFGNCEVVVTIRNSCGAAAMGPKGWGAGEGRSRTLAVNDAIRNCARYSRDCKPLISFCSPPDGNPSRNFVNY